MILLFTVQLAILSRRIEQLTKLSIIDIDNQLQKLVKY